MVWLAKNALFSLEPESWIEWVFAFSGGEGGWWCVERLFDFFWEGVGSFVAVWRWMFV